MSDNFTLGYVQGSSLLHRIDPLTKLLALTGIIIFAIGSSVQYNFIFFLVMLLLVPFSGVSFKTFLQPWKILLVLWVPFIIFPPIIFNLQSGFLGIEQETAYLSLLGLNIAYSVTGLDYGLKIAARGFAICLPSLLLLWTTHPRELVQTFVVSLKAPYKYAWSAFLALIYVPIVGYEGRMRNYALHMRGVHYRKMSIRGLKVFVIPVIMRALRRGFTTALSMESRGFGVYSDRTFQYDVPKPKYSLPLRFSVLIIMAVAITYSIQDGNYEVFIRF